MHTFLAQKTEISFQYYNNVPINCSLFCAAAPEPAAPVKFSIPHVCARFGPGGRLIQVLPNRPQDGQPARVIVQEMQSLVADTATSEEFTIFPGPLVK